MARQREERSALIKAQKQRIADELRARPRDLRKAFLWVTGQHEVVITRCEEAAKAAKLRDAAERQAMIDRHIAARRAFEQEIGLSRLHHAAARPDARQRLVEQDRKDGPSKADVLANPACVLEIISHHKADFSRADVKAERQVARFVEHESDEISLEEEIERFDSNLEELLQAVGVDVLPYPNTTTKELVLGGYSNRKPFKESGEGHKDFLIWKSIVADIGPADEPHVFVTSNTSDFAKEKTKETFAIHAELLSDLPDGVIVLGFTGRKSRLDNHVLPRFDGWKPWNESKVDLDIESFAERVIGKELPYKTMYGLEGLPFSNEVTLLMYGSAEGLVVHYALIGDQYMVSIRGESECLFDGYMEKWKYFSEQSDTMSGTDWNDHVVNVEAEAIVEFEIMAIYDPANGELGGSTLKVLNEIEDDLYQ